MNDWGPWILAALTTTAAIISAFIARHEQKQRRRETSEKKRAHRDLWLIDKIAETQNETDAQKWTRVDKLRRYGPGPLPVTFIRNKAKH